jgi:hypothetical protein
MTREQAEKERERLSREHPNATWLTREEGDGTWSVLRVNIAPNSSPELTAETRAEERPPTPGDPRSGPLREAPPFGAA